MFAGFELLERLGRLSRGLKKGFFFWHPTVTLSQETKQTLSLMLCSLRFSPVLWLDVAAHILSSHLMQKLGMQVRNHSAACVWGLAVWSTGIIRGEVPQMWQKRYVFRCITDSNLYLFFFPGRNGISPGRREDHRWGSIQAKSRLWLTESPKCYPCFFFFFRMWKCIQWDY